MSIKKIVFALALLVGVIVLVHPDATSALFKSDAANDACQGVSLGSATGCGTGGSRLTSVIGTIINVLSALVGIAAVIMLIVGGFKYITAAGDSSKTSSAKSTVIYSLVGLAIVALAQTFVRFVLDKVN